MMDFFDEKQQQKTSTYVSHKNNKKLIFTKYTRKYTL